MLGMLAYNQITTGSYITLDGQPYEVLSSQITKKQRQKPSNQTKLKNLVNGKVIERAFHQSDTVTEASLEKRSRIYLYNRRAEYWFVDPNNPKDRSSIDEQLIRDKKRFLKEKTPVDILYFDNSPIGIKLPIKVELAVIEAPPSLRGNTAQGGTKQITLETGAVASVPLFINEGDVIRINTETGQYVERVSKS